MLILRPKTMSSSIQLSSIKHLLNILLIVTASLFLTACGKSDQETNTDKAGSIPTLNDANIKQFTSDFSIDYIETQKSLLASFHSHQKANDSFGFTQFRNLVWTPAYIEKKNYYQATLDKNRSYIATTSIKPLFLRFENLIYIGINLKNGLLDEDQELITETLAEAKADKKLVVKIAKSISAL